MKYVIPTIDVEAIRTLSKLGSFEDLILGKVNDLYYGVPKILEVFEKYNVAGTFFVDFAEIGHGIERLKYLSKMISNNNSDVQLHIHPQFIADPDRYLLNQYKRSEQKQIFQKCIDIFEKCTGNSPLAFRAGGYGADENTISLLKEFKIKVDSSFFIDHKWCKLEKYPVNNIYSDGELFEIPVTVFNNKISYQFARKDLKKKIMLKKFDVDSCSEEELTKSFDAFKLNDINVIVLFLHSYSLIKWNYNYSRIFKDSSDIMKLDKILKYSIDNGYKIASLKDVYSELDKYISPVNNLIPEISTNRNIVKSAVTTLKNDLRYKLRGK